MKPTHRRASTALAVAAALLGLAVPLSGQGIVTLHGRVFDAVTQQPVFGAILRVGGSRAAQVTDSLGQFDIVTVEAEQYAITVEQLGYRTAVVTLPATATGESNSIFLNPDPIELDGLRVVVDQFERRRRFFDGTVRVVDQMQLLQTPALSAWDLLQNAVPMAQPCGRNSEAVCTMARGRPATMQVCLDQFPVYQGAVDLDRVFAAELYLMEVVNRGQSVRFYTRTFVDQMMEEGKNLPPLEWGCR